MIMTYYHESTISSLQVKDLSFIYGPDARVQKWIISASETNYLPLNKNERLVLALVASNHVKKVSMRGPTPRNAVENNKLYFELDGYLGKNNWRGDTAVSMNGYLLVNLLGVLNDNGCLKGKCGYCRCRLDDELTWKIQQAIRILAVTFAGKKEHDSWSISVMGNTGGVKVVPILIDILTNYSNNYKMLAADALGRIASRTGDKRAYRTLVKLAMEGNARLREKACELLAKSGDLRAVDILLEKLADRSKPVVRRAVISLGQLGHPRATRPLIDMMETNHWLQRFHFIEAICRLVAPPPARIIKEAFESKRKITRAIAVRACLRTGVLDDPEIRQLAEKQADRLQDCWINFDLNRLLEYHSQDKPVTGSAGKLG